MPMIKLPGFFNFSKSEDTPSKDAPEQSKTKECAETLNNIMTATKNPSTIFKPLFGINVEEHHSKLGEHAEHLWKDNKITDLTVKHQGLQYPCHKTVLSCYSKYFKELLIEQKGTISVVHLRLPSVTILAFEVLLNYMYTSVLNLTCQNIGEVYTASRQLGIDGALITCARIFTGQAKYNVHSVYVYVTAKKLGLGGCAAKALKIMTRRFEHIVGTPEFLDLDYLQVMEYLRQDVLATRSEVIVYLAALKWISVKYMEREQHAADLIGCVRFQMMSLNEVLACFSPPLLPGILEQKKIMDRLLTATCYIAAATVNEEKHFERYACKPRKYLLKRETIILWDTSIFDPDRHAMYVEEIAATTIQALYRGYKARKSILADKAAGVLHQPQPESGQEGHHVAKLEDEFDPPLDDHDETYVKDLTVRSASGSGSARGSRPGSGSGSGPGSGSGYSFLQSLRNSLVSFTGIGEEDENTEEYKSSSKNDETHSEKSDARERVKIPAFRRSSSTDSLISRVNNLAENTEIRKYTSDVSLELVL